VLALACSTCRYFFQSFWSTIMQMGWFRRDGFSSLIHNCASLELFIWMANDVCCCWSVQNDLLLWVWNFL
jgi:hypothetical protein